MDGVHEAAVATGACVWLTGRRGSGKSSVGRIVAEELAWRGAHAVLLDDDDPDLREHLARDDAGSQLPAVAWLSTLLAGHGVIAVVVSASMPGRAARDDVRAGIDRFVEVHVDAPVDVCIARAGKTDAYEEPYAPEVRVPTHDRTALAGAAQVVSYLETVGIAPA